MMIREFAPAKINLYLHITSRQENGYHDLDSLVGFADIGDEIALKAGSDFHVDITGPRADDLASEDINNNLVFKASQSFAELTGNPLDVHMLLVKRLPVASGIGGGSSDAAAALRALARNWGIGLDDPRLHEAAAKHGQDVPVCLRTDNCYMTALGVKLAPKMPQTAVVLANPGKALSTPEVYAEYRNGDYPFSKSSNLYCAPTSVDDMVDVLKQRGNDLYAPAIRLMPEIVEVIEALQSYDRCLLARMSGSGATCFGLFGDMVAAKSAVAQIRAARPHWWVEAGTINI